MFKMLASLFSSPERLLDVMSGSEMQEAEDDGERIIIDEDGSATVNLKSREVHEDFTRHVSSLRNAK